MRSVWLFALAAGNNPPATGSRLVGLIDEVRILDVARSAADILADASRP